MNKYHCTKENLKETIEKYGVAIIPNILDEKECKNMLDGIWDYFEIITKEWEIPIDRLKDDTWNQIYKLYLLHSMLIQYWNIGQAQVSWDIRQNPKIIEIFTYFWKTQELLVSFDGLSFNLPPEKTNRGWHRKNWFHTDQSFMNNEFKCLQSWVTALDVNEGDATLSFMESSNKYHKEFNEFYKINKIEDKKSDDYKKYKDNWYRLNEEEEKFYIDRGCLYNKIICKKGSLVLWDSRTIHCGVEAIKSREKPNIRAIIYLCYMPKSLYSKSQIEKKKKAFRELRTTNHWGTKLFPKHPRTYGKELPNITNIEEPKLNDIGKKLAGF
jgi:ectoine hydroxylase-related dioxygenase (phytanoyl-CoA dioxygenase family)